MRVQAGCTRHLAHEVIKMNKVTHRRECSKSRGGFSMMELVTVLLLIGIFVGIASTQYWKYLEKTKPDRASSMVGSYISLARNFSVQRRGAVTMAVDPGSLTIMIRTLEDTLRTMNFGPDSDLPLTVLDTNLLGDSLTFNPRGVCSVCGEAGKGITVSGPETTYFITFNGMGRWKRTLQ
jgi:prepilin-type N-terminal cleavage/methylation domain-containing protein